VNERAFRVESLGEETAGHAYPLVKHLDSEYQLPNLVQQPLAFLPDPARGLSRLDMDYGRRTASRLDDTIRELRDIADIAADLADEQRKDTTESSVMIQRVNALEAYEEMANASRRSNVLDLAKKLYEDTTSVPQSDGKQALHALQYELANARLDFHRALDSEYTRQEGIRREAEQTETMLRQLLDEATKRESEAQAQLNDALRAREDAETKRASASAAADTLHDHIEQLHAENEKLQTRIHECGKRVKEAEEREHAVAGAEEAMAAARRDRDLFKTEMDRLQSQLDEKHHRLKTLQEHHAREMKSLADTHEGRMSAQSSHLRSTIDKLRAELSACEGVRERCKSNLEKVQKEAEDCSSAAKLVKHTLKSRGFSVSRPPPYQTQSYGSKTAARDILMRTLESRDVGSINGRPMRDSIRRKIEKTMHKLQDTDRDAKDVLDAVSEMVRRSKGWVRDAIEASGSRTAELEVALEKWNERLDRFLHAARKLEQSREKLRTLAATCRTASCASSDVSRQRRRVASDAARLREAKEEFESSAEDLLEAELQAPVTAAAVADGGRQHTEQQNTDTKVIAARLMMAQSAAEFHRHLKKLVEVAEDEIQKERRMSATALERARLDLQNDATEAMERADAVQRELDRVRTLHRADIAEFQIHRDKLRKSLTREHHLNLQLLQTLQAMYAAMYDLGTRDADASVPDADVGLESPPSDRSSRYPIKVRPEDIQALIDSTSKHRAVAADALQFVN
jgi:hypothetical protein